MEASYGKKYLVLMKNSTWTLVPYNAELKVIGSKWVFRIKYNTYELIARLKARVVAKGFHQILGIDFIEAVSLFVKAQSIRTVLSLAISKN